MKKQKEFDIELKDAKEVKQPQITISSNGRVRTPSLKTVKLTPELVPPQEQFGRVRGSISGDNFKLFHRATLKCRWFS